MTIKLNANKIRPLAQSFAIEVPDEAGRVVNFRVQVTATRVSCWTDLHDGGSLTIPELFAHCVQAKARELEGGK